MNFNTLKTYIETKIAPKSFDPEQSAELLRIKQRKLQMLANSWANLLENLKSQFGDFNIREFPYNFHENSLKCQIKSNDKKTGVYLLLSLVAPFFGFYFCDYSSQNQNISAIVNIEGYSIKSLSYYPQNSTHTEISNSIRKLVPSVIDDYSFFDFEWSKYKIKKTFVENITYENIDLFQIVFTHDINPLI